MIRIQSHTLNKKRLLATLQSANSKVVRDQYLTRDMPQTSCIGQAHTPFFKINRLTPGQAHKMSLFIFQLIFSSKRENLSIHLPERFDRKDSHS